MGFQRWHVAGYDSDRKFFAYTTATANTTEEDIKALLQRLYSKFLTGLEIVECTPGPGQSDKLDVKVDRGAKRRLLMIGSNPHFTAAIYEATENPELSATQFNPPPAAPFRY